MCVYVYNFQCLVMVLQNYANHQVIFCVGNLCLCVFIWCMFPVLCMRVFEVRNCSVCVFYVRLFVL